MCLRLTGWGGSWLGSDSATPSSSLSSPASGPGSSRGPSCSPPQVSIRLDGENKAVEYNAVGAMKDAVRVVFRGPRVHDLFDRDWHKVALSVQAQHVSLYVDCALVQTLPLEERENIDIQGKTVIGKRLYDSVPIDVSSGVAGSPGRGLRSRGAPTPACVIYQVITVDCLRSDDPDSAHCCVPSFIHSFSDLATYSFIM